MSPQDKPRAVQAVGDRPEKEDPRAAEGPGVSSLRVSHRTGVRQLDT